MSNIKIEINGIKGLEDFGDTAAQNCSGGAFTYTGVNSNGNVISASTGGIIGRHNIEDITAFTIRNDNGGDSFTLTYRSANNEIVGVEEVGSLDTPQLHRGLGRLTNNAVAATVVIAQGQPIPGTPASRGSSSSDSLSDSLSALDSLKPVYGSG